MKKLRKVLLGLCVATATLGASFSLTSCNGPTGPNLIEVDGYTLRKQEDGTYALMGIPDEIKYGPSVVYEVPQKIGKYPISDIGSSYRVADWARWTESYMHYLETGNLRHLIVPDCIESVNTLGQMTIIETDRKISTMQIGVKVVGLMKEMVYFQTPYEEELAEEYQFISDENFENGLLFYETTDKESGESYVKLAMGMSAEPIVVPSTYQGLPVRLSKYAFKCCPAQEVIIEEGITEIPDYCFVTSDLQSISLPEGVEKIGEGAFNSTKLKELILPDSCTFLSDALRGCETLEKLDLNNATMDFMSGSFPNLKTIIVAPTNPTMEYKNEMLYYNTSESKKLVRANAFLTQEKVTIDSGVLLGAYAFAGNQTLKEVFIEAFNEEHYWMLDSKACFMGAAQLTKVVFGPKITSVPKEAFKDCAKLEEVVFENASYFGDNAFTGCGLKEIHSEKISFLCNEVFADNKNLTKVIIPNCNYIGERGFKGCERLTECSVSETCTIGSGAFADTPLKTKLNILFRKKS
ncbi:MAG: leucine-rich repeat domain-containing protein [Clostridia bacterium]|nr:leucine-rich repeat domain-containing protein [Clostridia bacterium]